MTPNGNMHQVDVGIAVGGLSSPLWLQAFEPAIQAFLLLGGALLLLGRLVMLSADLRRMWRGRTRK